MFITSVIIRNRRFPLRNRYPFSLRVFQETDRLDFDRDPVFFVGENGSGKSTLLEAIARKYGLAVWGGEKTHIVHGNPYETRLSDFLVLERNGSPSAGERGFLFRAENFFNYAADLDDMTMTDPDILQYYGGLSLHRQSHGEAFLSFLENRCRIGGLYLLDEPEAALSPRNQMAFLKTLRRIEEKGTSQFIISTHSPIILSYPGARIFSFDHIPIRRIAYEETRSYRFYLDFLNRPAVYLRDLEKREGTDGGKDTPFGKDRDPDHGEGM